MPLTNESIHHFPVASLGLERARTGLYPSGCDFPHLLPDQYSSSPLPDPGADNNPIPVQWNSFQPIQPPPTQLFTEGTLNPSFWGHYQGFSEDQDINRIRRIEPTVQPTTKEPNDVEMTGPPHMMSSVVSVPFPKC